MIGYINMFSLNQYFEIKDDFIGTGKMHFPSKLFF
jgi:hypothetical protein